MNVQKLENDGKWQTIYYWDVTQGVKQLCRANSNSHNFGSIQCISFKQRTGESPFLRFSLKTYPKTPVYIFRPLLAVYAQNNEWLCSQSQTPWYNACIFVWISKLSSSLVYFLLDDQNEEYMILHKLSIIWNIMPKIWIPYRVYLISTKRMRGWGYTKMRKIAIGHVKSVAWDISNHYLRKVDFLLKSTFPPSKVRTVKPLQAPIFQVLILVRK